MSRHSKKYPKNGVWQRGSVVWQRGENLWESLPVSATAAPHHKCTVLPVAEVWRFFIEVLMSFYLLGGEVNEKNIIHPEHSTITKFL
ncbi:MAG TPA: hypothetical protein VE944_26690 [Nostoc sp.]|uniref:hypothetical protein n=1 Tax=Nostoc sp. TaxID=1180 RepID=UPI002D44E74E|nr:hypothetical protein [Nostoc sp.]HYX17883.1 hypothetical protein [Nostoc sp.]